MEKILLVDLLQGVYSDGVILHTIGAYYWQFEFSWLYISMLFFRAIDLNFLLNSKITVLGASS